MKPTFTALSVVGLLCACATPPTIEGFLGTWEGKDGEDTVRVVLLNDGAVEPYPNGRKEDGEYKWKIVGKEVHAINKDGGGVTFRINPDGSLTMTAHTIPKDKQTTLKKIK